MPMNSNTPTNSSDAEREDAYAADLGGDTAEAAKPDAVAILEAEKAELKDKLLRTLADVENMRRRSEREAADARVYAVTNFARDMLNTADNIRRAIEAVPAGASATDPSLKAFVEGVELTERDFLKSLERHGVRRLDPKGSKFDPNMHQAMFEIPNPDVPTGTVVEVVQTGYAIGERVLRPAMVGVARGGPKASAANEAGEAPSGATT